MPQNGKLNVLDHSIVNFIQLETVSQNSIPCMVHQVRDGQILGRSLWLDMVRTNVDAPGRFQLVLTFILSPLCPALLPHLRNSGPRPINYRQAVGFGPTKEVATKRKQPPTDLSTITLFAFPL